MYLDLFLFPATLMSFLTHERAPVLVFMLFVPAQHNKSSLDQNLLRCNQSQSLSGVVSLLNG